jgi:hypothetical protein
MELEWKRFPYVPLHFRKPSKEGSGADKSCRTRLILSVPLHLAGPHSSVEALAEGPLRTSRRLVAPLR